MIHVIDPNVRILGVQLIIIPETSLLFLTAVADAVRTSLGPKGMDKMVSRRTDIRLTVVMHLFLSCFCFRSRMRKVM